MICFYWKLTSFLVILNRFRNRLDVVVVVQIKALVLRVSDLFEWVVLLSKLLGNLSAVA